MALRLAVDNSQPAKIEVRRADDDDMLSVYRMLLEEMYPETGVAELSMTKATQVIAETFAKGYVFVAVLRGQIIGSIGLIVGEPFWYSTDRALYDRWTYVKTEHRGRAFDYLLQAAKEMAENGSIPFVTAVSTSKDTDRKNRLFRRRGMTPIGEVFVRGFDRCVSETSSAVEAAAAEVTQKP